MRTSLFWRIIIPISIIAFIATITLSLVLSSLYRQSYENDLETSLTQEASFLAKQSLPYLLPSPDEQRLQGLADQAGANLACRVTIIDPIGKVLADSEADASLLENHANRPEVQSALQGMTGKSSRFSVTLGKNLLYVAIPIRSDQKIAGVMRLAVPTDQYEMILARITHIILGISGITFFIELAILILLAITTVRPIRQLTAKAIDYDLHSQWEPLDTRRKDEIGRLNQAFDHLVTRIADQFHEKDIEHSKLNVVLSSMSDGILIISSEGIVLMDNPAVRTLFGFSSDSSVGETLAKVVREYQLVECFQHCLQSQRIEEVSLEIPSRNIFLRCTAIPLMKELPGNVLLLFQDLTAIHQTETIRRDFISNVSHELRTPLASMRILTETIETSLSKDTASTKKFLGKLNDEIDNLIQLVQELLELARIESNKVPLKIKVASPEKMISAAIDRLTLQAKRAGLSINKEIPAGVKNVMADTDRVQQVLMNLIHNAIKFTPPPGQIEVGAKNSNDAVIFYVKDTGIGIPENARKRIFERFFKIDRSRSETGTGLGLSISKHLVEAHGGRIWAESEQDQGSTFFFTLPVHD
jgi:two-component system phosphate regulon sensor histidine kinase PhoR